MDIILLAGTVAAGIYISNNFVSGLSAAFSDPEKEKKDQARLKAEQHLDRLGRGKIRGAEDNASSDNTADATTATRPVMNEYESMVAMETVAAEDIPVGFQGELPRSRWLHSTSDDCV